MKKINGKLRYTTAKEIIEHVTEKAICELMEINANEEEQQTRENFINTIPRYEWIDKYCVNPYRITPESVSFLAEGTGIEVIFLLNKNCNKIKDYRIIEH